MAGHNRSNAGYDFAVARYTITGDLDSTFNDTGIVTTSISGVDTAITAITFLLKSVPNLGK